MGAGGPQERSEDFGDSATRRNGQNESRRGAKRRGGNAAQVERGARLLKGRSVCFGPSESLRLIDVAIFEAGGAALNRILVGDGGTVLPGEEIAVGGLPGRSRATAGTALKQCPKG